MDVCSRQLRAVGAPQAVVEKSCAPRLGCTSADFAGVSENRASCAHFVMGGTASRWRKIACSAAHFVRSRKESVHSASRLHFCRLRRRKCGDRASCACCGGAEQLRDGWDSILRLLGGDEEWKMEAWSCGCGELCVYCGRKLICAMNFVRLTIFVLGLLAAVTAGGQEVRGFDVPDALAGEMPWFSPYAFCGGDPVNFADPTGMDIYRYDKETGEMHLYKVTDDDFDQIGDFKYDKKSGEYELKTNRRGEAKTVMDHIEKGILRDGINMKKNDTVWETGGDGQPTVEGFQNFVIDFSEYLGVELRGYYYAVEKTDDIKYLRMGAYKGNTNRESYAGTNSRRFPYLINTAYPYTSRHTHPSNASDLARFNPSAIKRFIILTKGHVPISY